MRLSSRVLQGGYLRKIRPWGEEEEKGEIERVMNEFIPSAWAAGSVTFFVQVV